MRSKMEVSSENAAVLTRGDFVYGTAADVTAARPQATTAPYLNFVEQIKYLASEYFHGILFVALSVLFAVAVPLVLTKPEKAKAMVIRAYKRSLDVFGSLVGLLLTSPLFVILPVLIKLDSRGPVFYTQVRVGENRRRRDRRFHQKANVRDHRARDRRQENMMGRPFEVIKFRTMINDAEKKCGPVWATENDPRITRIGALLRKTRLDEIPQFINVLKGDMSLVGPRPERPNFVRDLATKVDNYSSRLEVKPGLTGLAQVENGYDADVDSVDRKVRLDLEYIRNWSVWADVKILFKTVIVVFTGKGAC